MSDNTQLIQRADLALSDFASHGLLPPQQANAFIDEIVLAPTIMQQARVVRMSAPQMKVNRLGFGDRVLHAAPSGTAPYAQDDGSNNRILAAAKRSAPASSGITLTTKERIAEVHIPYELLEDNIEGQSLEGHIMRLLAGRVAQDLEEWALLADTASLDTDLADNDGLLKTASAHVVDVNHAGVTPDMFESGMLNLPKKYHRDLSALRHYIPTMDSIRYRANVAKRATGYGDSALTTSGGLVAYGVPVESATLMPDNVGLFTFPQNILYGIQRAISVEYERNIRAREFIIVLTLRVDVKWDWSDAVVKYINLN